jgi:hypothetical protein
MENLRKYLKRSAIVMAAATATVTSFRAQAGITNDGGAPLADPVEYQISASGATALGALTRGANTNSQNFPTGEQNGLWRLGTGSLRIGRTVYTSNVGASQLIGLRDKNAVTGNPNIDGIKTSDRFVYQYHETGSINGVLATVKGGGIFIGGGNPFGNELVPEQPSQGAPRWRMGWSQISQSSYVVDGSGTQSATAGGYPTYEPPNVRIGYTDVRSFQAFAANDLPGTASPDRRPRDVAGGLVDNAQYGVGRSAFNPATGDTGTNFQRLANRTVIAGETGGDPNTSHIRNETVAIVPFAVVANPGTGVAKLEESDVRWLNGAGRLPNGANFNSVTREIGSGTRNQGNNNFNIDASWGGGERDRRSLAAGNLTTYVDGSGNVQTITDVNGDPATIRPGDEMRPDLDLFGVDAARPTSDGPKEHRNGPLMRFSDKNSGGSGVRPTVVNNRMAIGPNLSVGDVADRGRIGLTGTINSTSRTDPLRVVKIQFDKIGPNESDTGAADDGFNQPTAYNITNGRHQHWSAAQAVTIIGIDDGSNGGVAGDGKPDRRGTVADDASNPNKLIWNDTYETTDPSSVGIHRKFLNNIRQSVSAYPSTSITPADAVIDAGFVPEQVMKVHKDFDGGEQTWSNSPAGFDQSLYNLLVVNDPPAGAQNLKSRLNWIDPSTDPINGGALGFVGDTASAAHTYKIFARDVGNTVTTPTKAIQITTRRALAGDMDGNGVRDIQDVEEIAQAYAASEAQGNINGNGAVANMLGTLSSDDLIVLTDFNGSGNIDPASTNAAPVYRAVDRNDVLFFLNGATIDTVSANPDTGYAGSADPQTRREDGVRLGKLKKNQAIDTFNTTLQGLVGSAKPFGGGNWAQGEIDSLKAQKGDVDGNGVVNRTDGKILDSFVGLAPYSLSLADVLVNYDSDPIYAELTDDNLINHVDPDGPGFGPDKSDFQIIRAELASLLRDGDADFSGTVNSDDFNILATNFGLGVNQWSDADFDFNGFVNSDDFNLLASNFGLSASAGGPTPDDWAALAAAVPEPASASLLLLAGVSLVRRRR